MFDITVDTKAAERLLRAVTRLPKDMTRELDAAVKASAGELAQETRKLLRTKRGPEPSRPGEMPAAQSGALANSVGVRRGKGAKDVSWRVRTLFYGRFLEVGADRSALTGQGAAVLNAALKAQKKRRRPYQQRDGRGGDLAPRPFATAARRNQGQKHLARVSEALRAVLASVGDQ